MAVGILGRIIHVVVARIRRIVRLVLAVRRGFVLHAAVQDVSLGHNVARGEFLALAGGQAVDRLAQARQLVDDLHVRDRQVAVVRYRDLVLDRFAQRVALAVLRRRRRLLLNAQARIGLVRGIIHVVVARIRRIVRLVLAVRRGFVLHAAVQDVSLGHNVARGEFLALAGGQAVDRLAQARQLVDDLHVRDRQVAVVRYRDLVLDRFAQRVALAVRRRRRRLLLHLQARIGLVGVDRGFRSLGDIVEFRGYFVREAALENVGLCDRIGRSGLHSCAGLHIFKGILRQGHTFDFFEGDGLRLVINVGGCDLEGDLSAECIGPFIRRLGNNQARIDTIIRDR